MLKKNVNVVSLEVAQNLKDIGFPQNLCTFYYKKVYAQLECEIEILKESKEITVYSTPEVCVGSEGSICAAPTISDLKLFVYSIDKEYRFCEVEGKDYDIVGIFRDTHRIAHGWNRVKLVDNYGIAVVNFIKHNKIKELNEKSENLCLKTKAAVV